VHDLEAFESAFKKHAHIRVELETAVESEYIQKLTFMCGVEKQHRNKKLYEERKAADNQKKKQGKEVKEKEEEEEEEEEKMEEIEKEKEKEEEKNKEKDTNSSFAPSPLPSCKELKAFAPYLFSS
jgi:archaellum component FlaD/FlaE